MTIQKIYDSLSYDCLRAICFEINQGYDIKDIFEDLNIQKPFRNDYHLFLELNNGDKFETDGTIPLAENRGTEITFIKGGKSIEIEFSTSKDNLDIKQNEIYIKESDIEWINEGYTDKEKEKLEIKSLKLIKAESYNYRNYSLLI